MAVPEDMWQPAPPDEITIPSGDLTDSLVLNKKYFINIINDIVKIKLIYPGLAVEK